MTPIVLGHPHVHLRKTGSTNEIAKTLASAGAPSGTIVTASEQTAGRGRQGRAWSAPAGSSLLLSLLIRPFTTAKRLAPLATAIAVAEASEQVAAARCQIKWPNDVWTGGRKVAGILLEARPDTDPGDSWLIIGVGVNAAVDLADLPAELRTTAATLGLESPEQLLDPLLSSLARWLEAPGDQILPAWRARDALEGRQVRWIGGSGVASGIDDDGNLLVREADDSIKQLVSGEVHLSVGL